MMAHGTSLHALKDRARLAAGETLLVLGAAGGVGLAAVEIGKLLGATVIAAASTDAKLDLCRSRGADAAINYDRRRPEGAHPRPDRRARRRRRVRPGGRPVRGAGAAQHRVERPLPRRRLRRRRDSAACRSTCRCSRAIRSSACTGERSRGASRRRMRRIRSSFWTGSASGRLRAADLGPIPAGAGGRCARRADAARSHR